MRLKDLAEVCDRLRCSMEGSVKVLQSRNARIGNVTGQRGSFVEETGVVAAVRFGGVITCCDVD